MDVKKTGELIGAARRERGLTQRELAEALHVSDRTVSKWERGAGFPDVAQLEPLADALGLTVLSLLRGERNEAADAAAGDEEVRYVVRSLSRRMRERLKRSVRSILGYGLLLAVFFGVVYAMLLHGGAFDRRIDRVLDAGIYVDGVKVGETTITLEGSQYRDSYWGRVAVGCVEKTCREGFSAGIDWHVEDKKADSGHASIRYFGAGDVQGDIVDYFLYADRDLYRMALKLPDGTVVATDEAYAAMMALDSYYDFNF